jgi:hypothetical protein
MPSKTKPKWTSWDDEQLAKLQGIVSEVQSSRFRLECLRGAWNKMDDDEIEPLIEQLLEVHQELGEIFESLEEQQNDEQ